MDYLEDACGLYWLGGLDRVEQLVNEFSVTLPIDKAWKILTNVEKIAPCLPGAALEEIDGDVYSGSVKIKVGPIVTSYKGKASFVEIDDVAYKAVLKADGRDTKGQGNASATITAQLKAKGENTDVTVTTDLAITGKVAQFGRGILADVSTRLINQFVSSLEDLIANDSKSVSENTKGVFSDFSVNGLNNEADDDSAKDAIPSGPRKFEHKDQEPVDLLDIAGAPLKKLLIPAGISALLVILFLIGRRRKAKGKLAKG